MDKPFSHFGTDGIRGRVGESPITLEFLIKLGWSIGHVLRNENHPKIVMGKDTRISGYLIESALQAGLSGAGCRVLLLGPIPTAAIAYLTRAFRANTGIVISASHNPFDDNGVKLFDSEGFKTSKAFQDAINQALTLPLTMVKSAHLGKAFRVPDARGRYIEFCKSSISHQTSLRHLKIVIDCAHGSTFQVAPHVFAELGADVIAINDEPNGVNINKDCGTCHPEAIREAVKHYKADIGIAFDGDGDRLLMVDETLEFLDGDDILFIIAQELKLQNVALGGVVGTVMSNMGLEQAIRGMGLDFLRTKVGDQYIVESLLQKNWVLGGEPSGHVVSLDVNTTGDGIIAALQVLQAMKNANLPLHELRRGLVKYPQSLCNVPTLGKTIDLNSAMLHSAIQKAKVHLGDAGRILVRESGTEPLIRIMVEGEDKQKIENISRELRRVIEKYLSQSPISHKVLGDNI